MKIKLSKFGGVCMANAKNITKSANIIKSDYARKVVVVSAPGKRDEHDIKVTDRLYDCYHEIVKVGNCNTTFAGIYAHFDEIINAFNLPKYYHILETVKKDIENKKDLQHTIAMGEYIMAQLFADILGYDFIDAKDIIKFNSSNQLDHTLTYTTTKEVIKNHKNGVVVPGFYGANDQNQTITFTRDGTDFTASLVANALEVTVYENWKDVDGIFSANPNTIKEPHKIDEISYQELRKLSYLGAKVVHPSTVLPVAEKNIPIELKNFMSPHIKGTLITSITSTNQKPKAISSKSNLILINISKNMYNNETSLLADILQVLNSLNLQLFLLQIDIDTINIVIKDVNYKEVMLQLNNELCAIKLNRLKIIDDVSVVSIVGSNCNKLLQSASITLKTANITPLLTKIDNDGSYISVVVKTKLEEHTLHTLYEKLFR